MKMNELAVTEVQPNATTINVALNPKSIRENACDNSSAITAETSISNMSPSSCDSDSLLNSQIMVKRSLKLELSHNNNDAKAIEAASPEVNEDDLSFKSPTSPGTCKHSISLIFLLVSSQILKCS